MIQPEERTRAWHRLEGSAEADQLTGGRGADKIFGREGDDLLRGRKGDDVISGNQGDDTVFGGAGSDRIASGGGVNKVFGGKGDDSLLAFITPSLGGRGKNLLSGQKGDDYLGSLPVSDDTLRGGKGNDRIAMQINDRAFGGNGSDVFIFSGGTIVDFDPLADSLQVHADNFMVRQKGKHVVFDIFDESTGAVIENAGKILNVEVDDLALF